MKPAPMVISALSSWGLFFLGGCEKAEESVSEPIVVPGVESVTNERVARIATYFVRRELVWRAPRGSSGRSSEVFKAPTPPADESFSYQGKSEGRPFAVVISRFGDLWIGAVIGVSERMFIVEGQTMDECLCQIEGAFGFGDAMKPSPPHIS